MVVKDDWSLDWSLDEEVVPEFFRTKILAILFDKLLAMTFARLFFWRPPMMKASDDFSWLQMASFTRLSSSQGMIRHLFLEEISSRCTQMCCHVQGESRLPL